MCDLVARVGDLDQRFTPSPTALEGMIGHNTVTSRRPPNYQTEIPLTGEYKNIFVRGRADGYDPDSNQLEEIKTFKGLLERMPENHRHLHWAQARIYAWLLADERNLEEINAALVYYNVSSKDEFPLSELFSAPELEAYFAEQCEKLQTWADREVAHRLARDKQLATLKFPHPEFRTGQRFLSEAVYKTANRGKCLMAQAPTGIGKTLGTIFPLLKAMPRKKLDKIFFLTAKTSGRKLALDALEVLQESNPDLKLRTLELVAREKACEHPDFACHGESCPLAKGFYDRLPEARIEALDRGMMDKDTLREVARKHEICPYYLGQDLVSWSDVIIGDYNYYFDLYAVLYAGTVINEWRVSVLVDEAHNMIERGRKMYSAELDQFEFEHMRQSAPKAVQGTLNKLSQAWIQLVQDQEAPYEVYSVIEEELHFALQRVVTRITDYLADRPTNNDAGLLNFYFDALQFVTLADSFGPHSMFDITRTERRSNLLHENTVLCIRNVVPAPFLKGRFEAAQSATLFSATLSPSHFYSDMLGLPDKTPFIDVPSPFSPEQLKVQAVDHISTRFLRRKHSLMPIVQIMAKQYREQPGNYLLFVSSFDYLDQVYTLFSERCPEIPTRQQSRLMNEAERQDFINRFTPTSTGIAFAVLGGSFGEGIDLPGDRLVGAFIATIGLPQINEINEQMRTRMEAIFGQGYQYTYLYPGMQKVVQAAGRVIRTTDDRGVIYLIDDRYGQTEVRELLPAWWEIS
ncbi:ATP-dependent DNA helicase [Novimethylophilus kurashikiensis]|uniref:ATP-dependent DNA helicase n=1 Tax=Novimethylophilus kurashikiensis TaxID=1825523 RepID=A0A2R5F662_9PROT|nr:ATP-dependent DNA helicase [Novimethylophilus kurashikiensis]